MKKIYTGKCILFVLAFLLMFFIIFGSLNLAKQILKENNSSKITLLLDWTPNPYHAGIFLAQELGYFKEEGLNVKIIQPPEGGATKLVANGKAEFCVDFQDFLVSAFCSKERLPIKVVATLFQHNTAGVLLDPQKSNIRLSVWGDPIEKAILKYFFGYTETEFLNLNLIYQKNENIICSFLKNIDAAWIYYAWDGIIAKQHFKNLEFSYFKEKDKFLDYYAPVLVANESFLKYEPIKSKKFLKALSKGYTFAAENPKQSAQIFSQGLPELDQNLVYESLKYLSEFCLDENKKWGYISVQRWQDFYEFLYKEKAIEFIPQNCFTNEFLQ